MKILAYRGYMGKFDIIKIFCVNYLECIKLKEKTGLSLYLGTR